MKRPNLSAAVGQRHTIAPVPARATLDSAIVPQSCFSSGNSSSICGPGEVECNCPGAFGRRCCPPGSQCGCDVGAGTAFCAGGIDAGQSKPQIWHF